MLRSLYSAVSGLSVNQKSMDVIGNNIANVNTVGFKQGRAVFQDLMSQTLIGGKTPTDSRGGVNPRQVGSGAYLAAVDNIFEQGVLKSTSRTADLAIEGDGLFIVRGEGELQHYYTRAGDFNFDSSGTLTNPSGYKVQGWMSDPVTGVLNADASVGDIVLGPEYKIMQPKASSVVNLAGTLDTRATASTVTFNKFLTQATARQPLTSVTNASGVALDLVSGEEVNIRAHASKLSLMSELVDKNGTEVKLVDNQSVTFTFGNTPYSISYSAAGGQNRGDGKFNTVEEFIEEVNNIFKQVGAKNPAPNNGPVASINLVDGKFKLTSNSSFELTSITTDSTLQNILKELIGSYAPNNTETSAEVFFESSVTAMEDFDSLSGLALQINNAVNGSVVADGFEAKFLENNFGMLEGETISFNNIQLNEESDGSGADWIDIAIGPFTYTEVENPIQANHFHTVQELGKLITDAINQQAQNTAQAQNWAAPSVVNFGIIGNELTFNLQGGGAIRLGTASMAPAPGGTDPNPYLKTVFDKAFTVQDVSGAVVGRTLTDTQSYANLEEISGKGRIVYSYNKTNNNLNLNMDTGDVKMVNGDTLTFVIGGQQYTVTYPAAGWADGNAVATALNNALNGSNLQVTYNANGAPDGTGMLSFTANGADVVVDDIRTTSTTPDLRDYLKDRLKNVNIADGTSITTETQVPGVNKISGLTIEKGYKGEVFTENILPVGQGNSDIALNGSITSERFLSVADETTKMVDLFTGNGESFQFTENESSLNFNASIGNEAVTGNNIFQIDVNTTYGEMAMAIEEYLGLGREHNRTDNVIIKDGAIIVTGEKGVLNNIDYLNIAGSGTTERYGVFNNYMKSDTTGASGGILATNMALYDEQGNAHTVNFTFSLWNEEQNEWRLQIEADDPSNSIAINGATSNELVLKFNADGSLAYMYDRFPTPASIIVNPTLRFSAANGTNSLPNIALNLGSQGGTDGMVIAAAAGTFTQNSSDGYPQGNLESTLFNPAGEIVGSYTNGQVRTVGQVALATFVNNQGLTKLGDSLYGATGNSGQATIGKPQTGSRGDIAAGMLENSNVDLSNELVDMITTQRGFQSNSKVITTSDEMIQELLGMKR